MRSYLFEAKKRGVIFDVGHGGGFIVNVMSKFLNLGRPLQEVVLKSTWNSAKEIRSEKLGGNVMWDLNRRGSEPWEKMTQPRGR